MLRLAVAAECLCECLIDLARNRPRGFGLRPAISIKFNTAKRRTHSLFRRGAVAYALIPKMPKTRLRPLLERFDQMLREIPVSFIRSGS
jgi:hypothetical protein